MESTEKQFRPAHQENSGIRQEKEVRLEEKLVEETPPTTTGGVNAPESIIEKEWGVRKEEKTEEEVAKNIEVIEKMKPIEAGSKSKDEISFELMAMVKYAFHPSIREVLIKVENGQVLSEREINFLVSVRNAWWRVAFGDRFKNWNGELTEEMEKKLTKKINKAKNREVQVKASEAFYKEKYQQSKQARMAELRTALSALDNGEPIEVFNKDGRRTLFYDEDDNSFFVETDDGKKYITLGDVASDYAYGVDYVPDGNMPHSIFRKAAKFILANEAHRDIEALYNKELAQKRVQVAARFPDRELENLYFRGGGTTVLGFVAETMSRELLSRISYDGRLGYKVFRANVLEDAKYKIDFKLKTSRLKRGVIVEEEIRDKFKEIGVQFSAGNKPRQIERKVAMARKKFGEEMSVDDIVIVKIRAKYFKTAYEKWLREGKPSGGPEQFLSRDLKMRLLKESTKGLVKIKDEEIEKIFGDKKESSFAKASAYAKATADKSEDKEKLAA